MDKLMDLLSSTLEDEGKANDDYGLLIDEIVDSTMADELKILATTIVEKIRIDEETHFEMLQVLKGLIDNL